MIKTFSKFSCKLVHKIDNIVFSGLLLISPQENKSSIYGTLINNYKNIIDITINLDLNNDKITVTQILVEKDKIDKEIIQHFIDDIITEANKEITVYFQILNS